MRGFAVLETSLVVVPLVILSVGMVEIFRFYKASNAIQTAVEVASDYYRRPATGTTGNEAARIHEARAAANRALKKLLPSAAYSCSDGKIPCFDVTITREIISGRELARLIGTGIINGVLFSKTYTVRRSAQVTLEDNHSSQRAPSYFKQKDYDNNGIDDDDF
jgi:hypothetical protein